MFFGKAPKRIAVSKFDQAVQGMADIFFLLPSCRFYTETPKTVSRCMFSGRFWAFSFDISGFILAPVSFSVRHSKAAVCRFQVTKKRRIATTLLSCSEEAAPLLFINIKIPSPVLNDNLQQQLKLMYDYWFTQFDFPSKDGSPYRSSGGQMVPANGVSYPIPVDWQVETVFKNRLSSIIKPGVMPFTTKTYLATAAVNGTSISTRNTVDFETRESRANMQPTENSVWFAKMKKSIKHLYLNPAMKPLIEESILSTGFCGLQCSEHSFEYIASFIEHSYFEALKDTLAHGATQEAVNNDDLAGIALVIPSDEVLRLYHERTKGIYTQMSKNICENQELIRLRDWLLPMLINGQATVSD